MTRYRDLGLTVGQLPPGPKNAITDVAGVRVGAVTLVEGEGPLVRGRGPIRTGVTVILPTERIGREVVFAGCHRLNGNGELTGLDWVRESGTLSTPVAITNTHSVGVVRDALVAHDVATHEGHDSFWSLPVVGETYSATRATDPSRRGTSAAAPARSAMSSRAARGRRRERWAASSSGRSCRRTTVAGSV